MNCYGDSRRVASSPMNKNSPRSLDEVAFVDGLSRVVFEEVDGRQFVVNGNGDRIYGFWVNIDEPCIVPIRAPQ